MAGKQAGEGRVFNAIPVCGERDSLSKGGQAHWKMSRFQAGKLLSLACAHFFYQTVLNKSNSVAWQNVSFSASGGYVIGFTQKTVPSERDVHMRQVSSSAISDKRG